MQKKIAVLFKSKINQGAYFIQVFKVIFNLSKTVKVVSAPDLLEKNSSFRLQWVKKGLDTEELYSCQSESKA